MDILQARRLSCHPTNSIYAFKKNIFTRGVRIQKCPVNDNPQILAKDPCPQQNCYLGPEVSPHPQFVVYDNHTGRLPACGYFHTCMAPVEDCILCRQSIVNTNILGIQVIYFAKKCCKNYNFYSIIVSAKISSKNRTHVSPLLQMFWKQRSTLVHGSKNLFRSVSVRRWFHSPNTSIFHLTRHK